MTKKLHLLFLLSAALLGCVEKPQWDELPAANSSLPRIVVNTAAPVESKTKYVDAVIGLEGDTYKGSIRGRGNYTWRNFEKKPYKIQLSREASLLGLNPSREWILLADYKDLSMVRTAYLFELSQLAGLPYTPEYRYVEMYMNGDYLGVYILVETVKQAVGPIAQDGFIIEDDTYWEEESTWFVSGLDHYYTFKYPEKVSDSDKKFISRYIENVEDCLQIGDASLLDLESFAKWYIVNEVLGNVDPNKFFVLPSRRGKLAMGPVWDAESILGVMNRGPRDPVPSPGSQPTGYCICSGESYLPLLLKNADFVSTLSREWEALKPQLPAFQERMHVLAADLKEARFTNFKRWPLNDNHEAELAYIEDWLDRRIRWFDSYVGFLALSGAPVPFDFETATPSYPVPEAIDLGLSVLWGSFNLGASNERQTGYYYAWGETEPKSSYGWADYSYSNSSGTGFSKYCYDPSWWLGPGSPDNRTELEPSDDPVRVHLGGGWRMPTRWELWELWDMISYEGGRLNLETIDGIRGFRIFAPSGASVFFPCAGRAVGNMVEEYGRFGYYWTSSLTKNASNGPAGAYFLGAEGTVENINEWTCGRFYGMPVRPVRER